MSTPALALLPVLPASTGIGANTGPDLHGGHRHHAARESTDGKQESGEPGRFAGQQWPGAPMFPFSIHLTTSSCQHVAGGCP
jgi:hypothetical protein